VQRNACALEHILTQQTASELNYFCYIFGATIIIPKFVITAINFTTSKTYKKLSKYIQRVEDNSSLQDNNPFVKYGLPFPCDSWNDFLLWEAAITPLLSEEGKEFVKKAVCTKLLKNIIILKLS
jgi:hypothetical protein